jgi:general transcription factor 3C polypeptide 5 (transcription factor C subunit 1)
MFRSGPFRDAYVRHGIDPRKEAKWAGYQTTIFNFRTGHWRNQYVAPDTTVSLSEINTKSHLFTGKDVGTKIVCFAFVDILDPLVRKVIDESPLRDKFDVLFPPVCCVRVLMNRKRMGGILPRHWSRYGRL